ETVSEGPGIGSGIPEDALTGNRQASMGSTKPALILPADSIFASGSVVVLEQSPSRIHPAGGDNRYIQPHFTFFARVIRFSVAAWLLTKAFAISSTLKPHRMWRISTT